LLKYCNKLPYGGAKAMRKLGFLFACVILAIPCWAGTITVDDNGPADFDNIQAGINDANDGDTVVVAPGTYTGAGNRDIDFFGKAITVRSTEPNDPNIVAATIIDCEGTWSDNHCGFIFNSSEDANSILIGLTIRNGGDSVYSGAIQCRNSSPTITNCTLVNNLGHRGGGIYCQGSNPTIKSCTISGNIGLDGGGIYCRNSSPFVTDCIINGNWAMYGGGIYCEYYSNPIITNCVITGNTAEQTLILEGGSGGGVYVGYDSPTISNCIISDNSAKRGWGGGICCAGGSPKIINCTITGNSATYTGGGIDSGANATITNCVIKDNSAKKGGGVNCYRKNLKIINSTLSGNIAFDNGGGIHCSSYYNTLSRPTLTNCTITGNSAASRGGGICRGRSILTITNCIIWDNSGSEIYGFPLTNYCDIKGGQWHPDSIGNIDDNPYFVDPGYWADACDPNIIVEPNDPNAVWIEGDYHLLEGSPCIDTGDPNYVAGPNEMDLDGNTRVVDGDNDGNSVVDMGAYEYRPPTPAELAAELLEGVGGLELHKGISNSLEAKLNAALGALEDENENNDIAAINTLGAFINAVEAQRGKKIPEAEADALIAAAQEIIELLSDE